MKEEEIPLTEDELKFIVEDEFEQIIDLAKYNSFCSDCNRKTKVEMVE